MAKNEIYKNGAIEIQKQTSDIIKVQEDITTKENETLVQNIKVISVQDFLESLVSYLNDPFEIVPVKGDNTGTCVICGVGTNKPERKMCSDCMKLHRKNIYDNFKKGDYTRGEMIDL